MPTADIKKTASFGEYTINIASNNSVTVIRGGVVCDNSKSGLRDLAALVGFEVNSTWTTQQLGNKLVDAINNDSINISQTVDEKAKAEAKIAEKPVNVPESKSRRFAKSSTDKKLAGVCGGIAAWMGINSTIVRIAAILTVGFYFWGYVILCLAMPRDDK